MFLDWDWTFNFLYSFSARFRAGDIVAQFRTPTVSRHPYHACVFSIPEWNAQPSPDFHSKSRVIPVASPVQIET